MLLRSTYTGTAFSLSLIPCLIHFEHIALLTIGLGVIRIMTTLTLFRLITTITTILTTSIVMEKKASIPLQCLRVLLWEGHAERVGIN